MGKKYIIELEDKPFESTALHIEGDEILYRVKGFRSLVFDQTGLDRLESFKEAVKEVKKECYDAGYAQGLIQGKADARTELQSETEVETSPLQIGDEIVWNNGSKTIVLNVNSELFIEIDANGCVTQQLKDGGGYRKTGRHYDEVGKILNAIKG